MPDQRSHRGPHPEDRVLFAADQWTGLRAATSDLSWLLSHGYSMVSALKLVGDRYQLQQRQRLAVMRSACTDDALRLRETSRLATEDLGSARVLLDGYNVLTSVEAALGRGIILHTRDTCYRDMASMHGTYRKVAETIPALQLIGNYIARCSNASCLWYLDSPVSNSGRLKTMIMEVASQSGWDWHVELVHSPDAVLAQSTDVIATADSVILDHCRRWINLAREVISTSVPNAFVVNLADSASER